MSPVYSSPKSGSAAAATTPARLAKEFNEQVLWRTAPDGTTYVVTVRDGVLERYRVEEDGGATLVDTSRRSLARPWGYLALILGALLFVGAGLAAEALDDPRMAVLVVAGWLLFAAGIVVCGLSSDPSSRAHRAYGGKGEWHMPTNLRHWEPQSSEQLAAVERIADEHAGVAYVRDVGGRTIDVYAVRKGGVERFWVDEGGRTELAEGSRLGASHLFDRALQGVFLLLWLGLLVIGVAVDEHKGKLLLVVGAAIALVMVLGWRNDPEARLARRLKGGADDWIEIRTQEPDNDG